MRNDRIFTFLLSLCLALTLNVGLAQASEAPDQARTFDANPNRLQDFINQSLELREALPWHPDQTQWDETTIKELLSRKSDPQEDLKKMLDRKEQTRQSAEDKDDGNLNFDHLHLLSLNLKYSQSIEFLTSYVRKTAEDSLSGVIRRMR